MQHHVAGFTPQAPAAVDGKVTAPTTVTTTLYDVMATLQRGLTPEDDAIVVAVVAGWLRSGRLRFTQDITIAA